jgi:hypothetical protein
MEVPPMAIKKQYTASIPVQLTPEWRERVQRVADDEQVNLSMAQVIRDCILAALPNFELQLGYIEVDDLKGLMDEAREEQQSKPREDRSAGCFGGPPLPE